MERIFCKVACSVPAAGSPVEPVRRKEHNHPLPGFPVWRMVVYVMLLNKWRDSHLAVSPLLRYFCFHGGVIKSERVVFCRVPKAKIRFLALISKT